MFGIRCADCGGTDCKKKRTQPNERPQQRDEGISSLVTTKFECNTCGSTEVVEGSQYPEFDADTFDTVWSGGETSRMEVRIDGEPLTIESIDEMMTENTFYTGDGIKGTSSVHHIHIHALNPPTLSKGRHQVEIVDFIDEEFILESIRYHDQNRRTLEFFRSEPEGAPEPLDVVNQIRSNPESSC